MMMRPQHSGTVNRIIWRSRLQMLLRIGGILLMVVGGMFIPACRSELGPKSTIFNRTANTGAFAEPGVILIVVGAVAFAAPWLIRGYDDSSD
jgi:hypothetical protein